MPILTDILFVNDNRFAGAFGETTVANCNCYQGQAVTNADGSCSCISEMQTNAPAQTPVVQNVFPRLFRNRFGISKEVFANQMQLIPVNPNPTTQEKVANWIKDNPVLAGGTIAGFGVTLYLLLKNNK